MAFKYKATYKWNSEPKYIWSNIEDFFYWIKCFFQRGWRGYADCDVWDMHVYLIEVMLPMLKQLKVKKHGHPAAYTEARWEKIMDKMIKGLEAGERVLDDNYLDIVQPGWADELKGENWLESLRKHPIKKAAWKKYWELYRKDEKEFHEAMRLINRDWFALWD
jgi:hypothetical protein